MTPFSMSFIVARTYVLAIKGGSRAKLIKHGPFVILNFLRHLEYETYLRNLNYIRHHKDAFIQNIRYLFKNSNFTKLALTILLRHEHPPTSLLLSTLNVFLLDELAKQFLNGGDTDICNFFHVCQSE